jgi:hypothetical protein
VGVSLGNIHKYQEKNRLCTKCKNGCIGDEYHYIMECQGFELYDRKHLIDKNMWQRPNALELKYIMNCADKSKLEEKKQL